MDIKMKTRKFTLSINPKDTHPNMKSDFRYKVNDRVAGINVVYRYATKKEAEKHKMTQKILKGGFL